MAASSTCLECGAEIHPNSQACPDCGVALDEAHPREVDLPDEDFDYDDFVEREFGGDKELKPRGIPSFWWITAIVLTILFFLLTIGIL